MNLIRKACIVGASGAFGRIISQKLRHAGISTLGVDPRRIKLKPPVDLLIRQDFGKALRTQKQLLDELDFLIFCTPEEVVLDHLSATLNLAGLRICSDICSVKSRIQNALTHLPSGQQRSVSYVGIHPMFGPTSDFAGYNLCVIPMQRERTRYAKNFVAIVRSWCANVSLLSAKEHDSRTALSQAALHLSLVAYALAVSMDGMTFREILKSATPHQKILLSLAARISSPINATTNWQIQHANPYAPHATAAVENSLKSLRKIISDNDRSGFTAALSDLNRLVRDEDGLFTALSAALVKNARSNKAGSV